MYSLSLVSALLSFQYDSIYTTILSCPFLLAFAVTIHELGHALGCFINHNKLLVLRTPFFIYDDSKFDIMPCFTLHFMCLFKKSASNYRVYFAGLFSSFVLFVVFGVCSLLTGSTVFAIGCVLSGGILVINLLPVKGNDMYMVIHEFKKKR